MHLQHLADAGAHVALIEGSEESRADDDAPGRREGAEDVLGGAAIDRAFRADARIRLGEERGRVEVPGNAAQQGRGEEARDVLDDAAADGDQHVVAAHAALHQMFDVGGKAVQGLAFLARLDAQHRRLGEHRTELGFVKRRHPLVDDEVGVLGRHAGQAPRRVLFEDDLVGTLVGFDGEALRHG